MMGVLRWRHDLRSDAGQQQQQRPNTERSSTGHSNHAHAHTHTLPKLISQVSFSRALGNSFTIILAISSVLLFPFSEYRAYYQIRNLSYKSFSFYSFSLFILLYIEVRLDLLRLDFLQDTRDWLSFRSNPIRVFIVDRCRSMKGKYRIRLTGYLFVL